MSSPFFRWWDRMYFRSYPNYLFCVFLFCGASQPGSAGGGRDPGFQNPVNFISLQSSNSIGIQNLECHHSFDLVPHCGYYSIILGDAAENGCLIGIQPHAV